MFSIVFSFLPMHVAVVALISISFNNIIMFLRTLDYRLAILIITYVYTILYILLFVSIFMSVFCVYVTAYKCTQSVGWANGILY